MLWFASEILCQSCFKHLLWKQRSVTWKCPAEAFKGCGSQTKSNIWVWSVWVVHGRNLFIHTHPQMRISAAVRMHLKSFGIWVLAGDRMRCICQKKLISNYNIPLSKLHIIVLAVAKVTGFLASAVMFFLYSLQCKCLVCISKHFSLLSVAATEDDHYTNLQLRITESWETSLLIQKME